MEDQYTAEKDLYLYRFVTKNNMIHYLDLTTEQLKLLYSMMSSRKLESEEIYEVVNKMENHLAIPGVKR